MRVGVPTNEPVGCELGSDVSGFSCSCGEGVVIGG